MNQITVEKRKSGEPADREIELTILMPCLNEAETIAICVEKARRYLDESGVVGEVLVADNGSTDGSQDLARGLGARVVDVPARGYGAALIGGIAAARGRYVIMGDADDSYNFLGLAPFVERLRAGDQLVMGNRFKGGIAPGAMPPLHRWLGNPVLSFIGRLFYGLPIGDFHCGLRGFSRQAMVDLHLVSPGMEFASEMVVKAGLHGLRIAEVPTTLAKDGRSRPPHLNTWRDGWRHLRFLLLHSPKWLFLYPGALLLVMGLVGLGALLPGPLKLDATHTLDTHTLLVAGFAVVVGSQLVSFSVMARRYAAHEGFLPPVRSFGRGVVHGLTLERVLQAAAVLLLAGAGGFAWSIFAWAAEDFGPILHSTILRVLIASMTSVAVAVQMGATGFFASVFNIRRPTT
ncbi:MAG TPA: glycosyltransferase family 2 protein [Caulobacteraceae bacterium]|nr:glycosyltransferase family 2 protein [Caulobacteraceae bacterium]